MKIDKVTLTGLDSVVELDIVKSLSCLYPFVEWGILFSTKKEGEKRYPAMWVVDKIIKTGVDLSAHFCGVWAKDVLENQNFGIIKTLHPNFKRVQLNYNFSYNQKWSMPSLMSFADKNPERSIILQYNKSNKSTLDFYIHLLPENIHILYDASGGRGTEITNIQEPFKNYTGYAGGISNLNIEEVCQDISYVSDEAKVWIDMESGIRTNDIFDLEKCAGVLRTCEQFI
jgi:hypothetical protein